MTSKHKQGFLNKKGGVTGQKKWKKRYFVLNNSKLDYYAKPEDVGVKILGSIDLENAYLVDKSATKRPLGFQIVSMSKDKKQRVCDECKFREINQGVDAWQPDEMTKFCPLCTQKFGTFSRRHHCRGCGRIVCASCSKTERTIEYTRTFYLEPECESARPGWITSIRGNMSQEEKTTTLKSDFLMVHDGVGKGQHQRSGPIMGPGSVRNTFAPPSKEPRKLGLGTSKKDLNLSLNPRSGSPTGKKRPPRSFSPRAGSKPPNRFSKVPPPRPSKLNVSTRSTFARSGFSRFTTSGSGLKTKNWATDKAVGLKRQSGKLIKRGEENYKVKRGHRAGADKEGWRKMYCVLRTNQLSFYHRIKDTFPPGRPWRVVELSQAKLIPHSKITTHTHAFQLNLFEEYKDGEQNEKGYHLAIPPPEIGGSGTDGPTSTREDWIVALSSAMPNKIFDVPIALAAQRTDPKRLIPGPIIVATEWLNTYGLREHGLYRIPGSKSEVERLIGIFDQGEMPKLQKQYSPSNCASLVVQYLKRCPDDLFGEYEMVFKQLADDTSNPKQLKMMRKLVRMLPPANRNTIDLLCDHLIQVASYSEENQMSAAKLSMCIYSKSARPLQMCIENHKFLFSAARRR